MSLTPDAAFSCAIAVMAKAPRPNQVKTRLVPPLTPEEAAGLNASFLRDITENIGAAARAVPIAGYVAYAPDGEADRFHGLLAPDTQLVLADGSISMPPDITGIGRGLLHAATSLLGLGFSAACLVNSDSPTLPTGFLVEAVMALTNPGDRMVLGMAEDGGYYLIGLKCAHPALFRDITWSTDQVSEQTLDRARGIGLEVVTLPLWFDVDDAASLVRLIGHLRAPQPNGPTPYAAPATRAWLAGIALEERLRALQPAAMPA